MHKTVHDDKQQLDLTTIPIPDPKVTTDVEDLSGKDELAT